MKSRILAGLTIVAFAVAAVIPIRSALHAASPQPRPAAAPAAAAPAPPMPAEPHPEIRAALAALRQARSHLQHGAHDFGGHRSAALKLTNEAIQQCRTAIAYDRH
ncbi:MAG: hypothetical protein ACRD11_03210 [Terriglobia bacterium]